MCEQQLDLFSSPGIQADRPLRLRIELRPAATVLDDQALIAAIPNSNLADSIALAAEAGRRRLTAAIPSLEALCRRFSGFGIDRVVPEQAAALQALAAIGGREAARAVSIDYAGGRSGTDAESRGEHGRTGRLVPADGCLAVPP
jgi:hypothetical protein